MDLQFTKKLLKGGLVIASSILWLCIQLHPVSAAPSPSTALRSVAKDTINADWASVLNQGNTPTPAAPITDTTPLTSTSPLSGTAPQTPEASDEPEAGDTEAGDSEAGDAESSDAEADDAAEDGEGAAPLDESQLDALYSDTLEGTIIANRTTASVSFFVEGELYRLAPLRSLGIDLPRSNSVLNLFSCDADSPESDESCFWDPFLINADGFYEVFNDAPEGSEVRLVLEAAGTPPTDQIWIQNRTGEREVVVYEGETYELAPSAVVEFEVGDSPIVTFYRRSCLAMNGRSVCEWAPQSVEPGFYYALDEISVEGGPPNSQIITVAIEPVLGQDGQTPTIPQAETNSESDEPSSADAAADSTPDEAPAAETATSSADIVCQLQVPVLNVRAGPGLDYLVVSQVNSDFGVVGRDATGEWLAVAPEIADGGWVVAGDQFAVCNGDTSTLAIAEVTDGRLEPTPEPSVDAEVPAEGDPGAEEGASADGESADGEGAEGENADGEAGEDGEAAETDELDAPAVEIPNGQALLIVTNAFEQDMRFTLSPDEYDLLPGETIYVVVNPGRVQFSVSSPWRGGISGNAEFLIEPDQSQTLYLYFVQSPNDSDDWNLYYQ